MGFFRRLHDCRIGLQKLGVLPTSQPYLSCGTRDRRLMTHRLDELVVESVRGPKIGAKMAYHLLDVDFPKRIFPR